MEPKLSAFCPLSGSHEQNLLDNSFVNHSHDKQWNTRQDRNLVYELSAFVFASICINWFQNRLKMNAKNRFWIHTQKVNDRKLIWIVDDQRALEDISWYCVCCGWILDPSSIISERESIMNKYEGLAEYLFIFAEYSQIWAHHQWFLRWADVIWTYSYSTYAWHSVSFTGTYDVRTIEKYAINYSRNLIGSVSHITMIIPREQTKENTE